jgi:hypothetical protein
LAISGQLLLSAKAQGHSELAERDASEWKAATQEYEVKILGCLASLIGVEQSSAVIWSACIALQMCVG